MLIEICWVVVFVFRQTLAKSAGNSVFFVRLVRRTKHKFGLAFRPKKWMGVGRSSNRLIYGALLSKCDQKRAQTRRCANCY